MTSQRKKFSVCGRTKQGKTRGRYQINGKNPQDESNSSKYIEVLT